MKATVWRSFAVDQLKVQVFQDRAGLGAAAAEQAIERIVQLQKEKDMVRMIFAAAPSQNEFLQALTATDRIDWSRITAFHMDEYIGLSAGAPQAFSRFLTENLFDIVRPSVMSIMMCTSLINK